jgi:hypothetical protein
MVVVLAMAGGSACFGEEDKAGVGKNSSPVLLGKSPTATTNQATVSPKSDATGRVARAEKIVTEKDREHWAYRPLAATAVPVPPVTNRRLVKTPVDSFVIAALEAKRLTLSSRADARTLVRRLYFDLIGLPPTPAQVAAFQRAYAADPSAAVASLVDELLASPQYGERWARHWLDVVRYADSDGQESDADRPTAYHYRDFVIRSLNEDLPFDTFVRWQLAGDELEPGNRAALAATGFIAAGTHAELPANLMEEERTRTRFNELDDMIATTGSAFLGLTLACARCHDHKYDPIPRRDYYRLLCAFNGGDRAAVPLASPAEVERQRTAEARWAKEQEAAQINFDDWRARLREVTGRKARGEKVTALKISDEDKKLLMDDPENARARELAKKYAKELQVEDADLLRVAPAEERAAWKSRERVLKAVEARKPSPLPTAFGYADFDSRPRETWLLARGDFRLKDEPVELGFLSVLTRGRSPAEFWATARQDARRKDSTQQRRALAEWMTDVDAGAGTLAARVIVNRVWQHHFGEGLVRTVSDFGARGERPSHPELLEWLTREFVRGGWRLKPLHRWIVTSSTYLQGSGYAPGPAAVDPDNRLLWRRRPQRIESEALRDAMLAVSGTLNDERFGPAFKPPIAAEAIQARNMKDPYPKNLSDTPATRRRSIYLFHKRVVQYPLLQAFDGPDAQASCGRRVTTTVAPQALALLNDRFVRDRAADFARRVQTEAGPKTSDHVRQAWLLALGREPSTRERESALAFLERQARQRVERGGAVADQAKSRAGGAPAEGGGKGPGEGEGAGAQAQEQAALTDFCQALFALNEFVYVD